MATDDLFQNFVNKELPKRVSSDENPLNVAKGLVPVTTGVGLGVEFLDPTTIETGIRVELVTVSNIPYAVDGTGLLPSLPLGDFVFNTARLTRSDGSIIEVDGITKEIDVAGNVRVRILNADHLLYGTDIATITVSYLQEVPPPVINVVT